MVFAYSLLQLSILSNCIRVQFRTAQTLKYTITIAAHTNISVLMNKKLFHFSTPPLRPHALVPYWKHFWGAAPFSVGRLLWHPRKGNSWTNSGNQINAPRFLSPLTAHKHCFCLLKKKGGATLHVTREALRCAYPDECLLSERSVAACPSPCPCNEHED